MNDQFYNPFSRMVARTRKKLAKWVVKPNYYLTLGFTTHLANFIKTLIPTELVKRVVKPKVK